jgi:prophage regulatory protein
MRNDDNEPPKNAPPRLLSKKQVLDRVPFSYPTLWKMMKLGKFPKSRRVGGKAFWLEAEISTWILSQT